MMLRRFSNILIVLIFALIVGLPLLSFSSGRWTDPQENRASADRPHRPRSRSDLLAYPSAFEAFFDDHFGQRKKLIALRDQIDFRLFRRSPTPKVLLGHDDWLFYTGDKSLEDYRGLNSFSTQELDQWEGDLKKRRDYAKSHGVAVYQFVIAPNKQSIYPENMPENIVRAPRDHLDELSTYLALKGEQSLLLDLRPALLSRKADFQLYHSLDAHWNAYGAYIAYRAIIDGLVAGGVKNLAGLDLSKRAFAPSRMSSGDLSDMMGIHPYPRFAPTTDYYGPVGKCLLHEMSLEPANQSITGRRPRPDMVSDCESSGNTLRVLVLHDSMIQAMEGYLANSFGHVRFAWLLPVSFDDFALYIAREHPDIVIEERVERGLNEVPTPAMISAAISTDPPPSDRSGWLELTHDDPREVVIDGWGRWEAGANRRSIFVNTNLPVRDMTVSEIMRPDVAMIEHDNRFLRSGFRLRLNIDSSKPMPDAIRLCIWTEDPVFGRHRLNFANHQELDTCPT